MSESSRPLNEGICYGQLTFLRQSTLKAFFTQPLQNEIPQYFLPLFTAKMWVKKIITFHQANSAFKTHSHFGFIIHVLCLSIETSQNALKIWCSHQKSPCTLWSFLKHRLISISGPMSHVHFSGCLTLETLPFRIWYNMN